MVDINLLLPEKYFEIQLESKNPIRLQCDHAEMMCRLKNREIWAKVDFSELEGLSKIRWKFQENKSGYYAITATLDGTTILMSRTLISPERHMFVDHINGDPTDNRLKNLRECTHSENMRNRKTLSGGKYKGIYYCKNKGMWKAQIKKNGKTTNLGSFYSPELAAKCYDKAALDMYGDFARLNNV